MPGYFMRDDDFNRRWIESCSPTTLGFHAQTDANDWLLPKK